MKSTVSVLLLFLLSACGGGSGGGNLSGASGNSSGSTTGTVNLSGADTVNVGTQLNTGFIGSSVAAGGQPDHIAIVDKSSTVTFTAPNILTPNIADSNNGFVVVVTDDSAGSGIKAISMSIVASGTKYDYACTNPVSTFIDCGTNSITLNIGNKTVTFNNAMVTNVNTSTILVMDGTLTW